MHFLFPPKILFKMNFPIEFFCHQDTKTQGHTKFKFWQFLAPWNLRGIKLTLPIELFRNEF